MKCACPTVGLPNWSVWQWIAHARLPDGPSSLDVTYLRRTGTRTSAAALCTRMATHEDVHADVHVHARVCADALAYAMRRCVESSRTLREYVEQRISLSTALWRVLERDCASHTMLVEDSEDNVTPPAPR